MFNFFSFIASLYTLKFYDKTCNPLMDIFYMNPGISLFYVHKQGTENSFFIFKNFIKV